MYNERECGDNGVIVLKSCSVDRKQQRNKDRKTSLNGK